VSHRAINFQDKLARFTDRWAPKVIAEMNDYQFKLVKIEGEFVWHSHADTDEVFIVLDGHMRIELATAPWNWARARCSWCPGAWSTSPRRRASAA
jgi:mannose-6-phosphate isomerase-like protein (cupin superfamily)